MQQMAKIAPVEGISELLNVISNSKLWTERLTKIDKWYADVAQWNERIDTQEELNAQLRELAGKQSLATEALSDAHAAAEKVLADARNEAQAIREKATQEADKAKELLSDVQQRDTTLKKLNADLEKARGELEARIKAVEQVAATADSKLQLARQQEAENNQRAKRLQEALA